jgi:hypothetical protein
MILPDLVLGKPGACWTTSGEANGPIFSRTVEKLFSKISFGELVVIDRGKNYSLQLNHFQFRNQYPRQ